MCIVVYNSSVYSIIVKSSVFISVYSSVYICVQVMCIVAVNGVVCIVVLSLSCGEVKPRTYVLIPFALLPHLRRFRLSVRVMCCDKCARMYLLQYVAYNT